MKTALILLILSSIGVGIMSIIRKEYQEENGPSFKATALFIALTYLLGGIIGFAVSGKTSLGINTVLAVSYAIISTVTAAICTFGTAYGSLSTLVLIAMLGSLALPSLFGLIAEPAENQLSLIKIIGFICAAACIALNFFDNNEKKKSSSIFKLLLIIVFFTNGVALIIFNLEVKLCPGYPYFSFISEYMLISSLLAITALCFSKKSEEGKVLIKKILKTPKNYRFIIGYAVISFASEILCIKCTDIIPLIVQSPLSFAIPIIVTVIFDYVVYKIKPNKTNIYQMILAMICCLCFVL